MQNLIVIIIGLAVLAYVSWKTYKTITRKPSPADKCGGCTGCALKVNMECTTKEVQKESSNLQPKKFKLQV